MSFGGSSKGKERAVDPTANGRPPEAGEGHIIGGGGRGRDGQGTYEMVGMAPREPA